MQRSGRVIFLLSVPLAILAIISGATGLLTPDFYIKETSGWQAQSLGQDIVNLFVAVPFLLLTVFFVYRKSPKAHLLWGGVNLYLAYTFVIYCFDVHFNKMFVVYCLALGLSLYSFLYFLFLLVRKEVTVSIQSKMPIRITAIYFILLSTVFYVLWLMEIIPAVLNDFIPKSVTEAGLFTNAVHVIDLSVILPAIFITGILLLRRNDTGLLLAPAFLTFFIIMNLTIGGLIVVMKNRGLEAEYGITIVMGLLAVFSAVLLMVYFSKIKITGHS